MLGAAYARITDATCSTTTVRNCRDEWICAEIFTQLEQICLHAYDAIVGLNLSNLTVDGCIIEAPCGGEAVGRSPVDRGKQGTKRSLLTDGAGIPLGRVAAPANRMTPRCCARLWGNSAGSIATAGSGCQSRSPCTSTPDTTR